MEQNQFHEHEFPTDGDSGEKKCNLQSFATDLRQTAGKSVSCISMTYFCGRSGENPEPTV